MTHQSVVLVIDDDAGVRRALAHALAFENFRVVGAASGQEALNGLGASPVDVALVDQDLGWESGWDALKQLRKSHPGMPAIIMTARPESGQTQTEQTGDTLTMKKPLDLPLLFQTLVSLAARTHISGLPRVECSCGQA